MNKLLEKQVKKFLPDDIRNRADVRLFIEAISNSYKSYERELDLSDRAFRLSEEEYKELNNRLKKEIEVKKNSIDQLKEAVARIGDESWTNAIYENDLLGIVTILNKQIDVIQKTKQEQQEQKQFYERILNIIPADIAVVDSNHKYLFVNPSGIKDESIRKWIIGKTDLEYHKYRNRPVEAAQERLEQFKKIIESKKQQTWEEKIVTKTGETEYHLRMLHPVFHEDGSFDLMVIYGLNITERKKIEEQVRISELRYKSIFDNSQALICTHNLDGIVLDVNQASCSTLGYAREELIGQSIAELLLEDERDSFYSNYLNEVRKHGSAEGIMHAVGKNGEKLHLLYKNFVVQNDTDQPYVIGFSQDITPRIKAENALKASEEKYRRIIENMNLGLLQVSPTEEILYANQSFCDMSGYSMKELAGKKAPQLFTASETWAEEIGGRRKAGKSDAYELKVKTKTGEDKWWLISGAPILNDNNEFTGSIGIHLDITSQKEIETELKRAKLQAEASSHAKEAFLANMSHEIRTPMNAIIGIGKLLGKTELEPQQKYYLDIIQNASSNLLVIVNDLLDFSKIESGKIVLEHIPFRMQDQVDTTRKILHHKAEEKGLLFRCECDPAISPVLMGDPTG